MGTGWLVPYQASDQAPAVVARRVSAYISSDIAAPYGVAAAGARLGRKVGGGSRGRQAGDREPIRDGGHAPSDVILG